jgi:hypothetical protein
MQGVMSRMMLIFMLTYTYSCRIHIAETRMGTCLFRNVFVLRFARCLDAKTPHEKRKSAIFSATHLPPPPPPAKNVSVSFSVFLLFAEHCDGSCCSPPPPPHGALLEDLFELSRDFDSPINWRVRLMYFYYWGDFANLRNRAVRTRVKRGTILFCPFCWHKQQYVTNVNVSRPSNKNGYEDNRDRRGKFLLWPVLSPLK